MDREDRIQFLLSLVHDEHWYVGDHRMTDEESIVFRSCTEDDFEIAVAMIEAAMAEPVMKFTSPWWRNLAAAAVSRWNVPASRLETIWRWQEAKQLTLLELGSKQAALKAERDRRWPHLAHHWWSHS